MESTIRETLVELPQSTKTDIKRKRLRNEVSESNHSSAAVDQALEDVKNHGSLEVPLHLRNASSELAQQFGYGKPYKNPHFDPTGAAALK